MRSLVLLDVARDFFIDNACYKCRYANMYTNMYCLVDEILIESWIMGLVQFLMWALLLRGLLLGRYILEERKVGQEREKERLVRW